MANYFSNAFFHKTIRKPFIASKVTSVGKIVATVKCEDFRGALVRMVSLRKSLAGPRPASMAQMPWGRRPKFASFSGQGYGCEVILGPTQGKG